MVDFGDFRKFASDFGGVSLSYAEDNIDLINGVDFVDFLILSGNFGRDTDNHVPKELEAARNAVRESRMEVNRTGFAEPGARLR